MLLGAHGIWLAWGAHLWFKLLLLLLLLLQESLLQSLLDVRAAISSQGWLPHRIQLSHLR